MTVDLLRAAIQASGLSTSRFAREVVCRDPGTVFRWLAGGTVPRVAREQLERYVKEHGPGEGPTPNENSI